MELDLWKILQEMLSNFASIVPNLLGALAIFIIGLIVAKLTAKFLRRLLVRIGADRLAEQLNSIEIVSKSNIKLVPSVLLSKIVYYFLFFIFLVAATDVLNLAFISKLMGDILNYVPIIISALIMLVIGLLISDFMKNVVRTACDSLGIPAAGLIANIVFYFLFLNVVMIALSQAKIDTGFIQDNLSIILGGIVLAFAIGYGFASRDIVANFLASFYNKGKIRLGDVVELEGVSGEVIAMDSATLTIRAEDRIVLFPMHKLTSAHIDILKQAPRPAEGRE